MTFTNTKVKFLIFYQCIVDVWKQGAATYLVLLAIAYLATGYLSINPRFFYGFMNHGVYLFVLLLVAVSRIINYMHMGNRNRLSVETNKREQTENGLAAFTTFFPFFIPLLVELLFLNVVVHFALHIILIMMVTFIMELCATHLLMLYVQQATN